MFLIYNVLQLYRSWVQYKCHSKKYQPTQGLAGSLKGPTPCPLTLPSVLHFSIDMWMVSMIVSNWVVLPPRWHCCYYGCEGYADQTSIAWYDFYRTRMNLTCVQVHQAQMSWHVAGGIEFSYHELTKWMLYPLQCCSKRPSSNIFLLFQDVQLWFIRWCIVCSEACMTITTPKVARHTSSVMQKKSPRAVVVVGLLVTCTLPSESSDDALPHQLEIHNGDSEVWLVSHWESISICNSALCIPMRHV